jgi:drug/metabolite transporter (DMT)-like permease
MAVVLALCSALVYGTADYFGGHASRRMPAPAVTAMSQAFGLAALLMLLPALGDPIAPARDWAWGAAGGAAGAIGLICFYRALAEGVMSIVAPTTAVVSAAVPVAAGLLLGERPAAVALAGAGLAVVAIALVSGGTPVEKHPALGSARRSSSGGMGAVGAVPWLALVAGCGFGAMFVALDRVSDDSGLWPLVAARVVSIPIGVLLVVRMGRQRAWRFAWPHGSLAGLVVAAGVMDMTANVLYLLAVQRGLLAIVGAVAALYPVSTVVLAYVRDGERVSRGQVLGLGVAATSLVMVGLG